MFLWKVERTDGWDYDEYDSFIIVARTEEMAKLVDPDGTIRTTGTRNGSWPVDKSKLKVTKIGVAAPEFDTAGEVILASFNAG